MDGKIVWAQSRKLAIEIFPFMKEKDLLGSGAD